jgi:DNA-binding CsgD family transcriptional regulator
VGLTTREIDVLGLVAAGLTNPEIADRLYLSINSIKTYIRTAYHKIGGNQRAQAIWVERYGLTPPSSPSPTRTTSPGDNVRSPARVVSQP